MKKLISLALALCLVFSLGISASATASIEKVDITYRNIKLELDGDVFIPCDENGKTVEPFIMKATGTTYLPVRALAQALGLSVGWDGKTSTVILSSDGEVKTGTDSSAFPAGDKNVEITYRDIKVTLNGEALKLLNAAGEVVEPFIMDGTTYLPLRVIGEALGLDIDWDSATSTVILADPEAGDKEDEEVADGYWLPTKETVSYGNFYSSTTTHEYDAKGNETHTHYVDADGITSDTYFTYDKNGDCIEERFTNSLGAKSTFRYTDTEVYEEVYDPYGSHYLTHITLNKNGDILKASYTDFINNCSDETTYEYDSQGRVIKETFTSSDEMGDWGYTDVHTWSGNVRSTVSTDTDGVVTKSTITYTYDSEGRVIKEVYDGIWVNEIMYDKYGNECYRKWSDAEGNYTLYRFEINEDFNTVLESYEENGVYHYFSVTEFDENDNIIHESYSSDLEGYTNSTDYFYDADGRYTGKYYEDNANYMEETVFYDNNGHIYRVEQESGGDTTVYTVKCNEAGLVTYAEGTNGDVDEVYTFEYAFFKY